MKGRIQNVAFGFVVALIFFSPFVVAQTGKRLVSLENEGGVHLQSIQAVAMGISVVNMSELARLEALNPNKSILENLGFHPNEVEYEEPVDPGLERAQRTFFSPQAPLVASPSPTATYRGLQDTAQVGTSSSYIPPDTHGAVGVDKVMVTHNNNIRILSKATGAVVSTVSLNGFWSSTGATGVFDPRVLYDPYNSRWIIIATSNASSSSSSICVGVSTSSDPSGSFSLFKVIVGTATLWADYPVAGFNKNWVAIGVNMFTIAGGAFSEGRVLSVDYPTLRTGSFSGVLFTGITPASGGFCMNPAQTFSSTEDTLFFVSHLSSGGATYKLQTMTGTAASPTLTIGVTKTNSLGGWVAPGGELLPQSPEPLPGTGTRKIETSDAYMRGNVLFRNGSIFDCQTVGLPSGGLTHTGVQWARLTTLGDFAEGGRVEDPTATATNGGKWYAYASIAVNSLNDILLGFSQFSSAQSASAGYTYKARGDAVGTMRDPYIYKAGISYYEKTYGGGRNRWGDYSQTCVDPVDDFRFWTIQEFADTKVGTGDGSGRWNTWWANVIPPDPLPIQLASFTGHEQSNSSVLLEWRTISELNNYGFFVERREESEPDFSELPNAFIPGHGTTNEPQDYSYVDATVSQGNWQYRLKQVDLDATVHYTDPISINVLTDVNGNSLTAAYQLFQNYPNPFNPSTTIRFALAQPGQTMLRVFDVLGREVATLVNERMAAGQHGVEWAPTNLPSGVYYCRLEAVGYVNTQKLVMLK
jgi:hypothetical protein